MNINISDLMADYQDDTVQLSDPGITTADRVFALALGSPVPAARHTPRRIGRTILIAAALAVALAVAAVAAYQYSIRDAVMDVPVGPNTYTSISLNGLSDSPEYQAYQEWTAWNAAWETENADRYEKLGVDDSYAETEAPYLLYGAAFQAQADKLDEIAAKYGLALHTARTPGPSDAWLTTVLGADIFSDAYNIYGDYIYEDGSFSIGGSLAGDEAVQVGGFSAVKGSISSIFANWDGTDATREWSYTAPGGQEIVLAVTESRSFMVANLENCYFTLIFSAPLAQERLEALADGVDLTALDRRFEDEAGRAAAAQAIRAWWDSDPVGTAQQEALAELGNFEIPNIPEKYELELHIGDGTEPVYHERILKIANYKESAAREDTDPYGSCTLQYVRFWSDGDKTLCLNESYAPDELIRLWDEMSGNTHTKTDLTLHGYPLYTSYDDGSDGGASLRELCWADTERGLVFSLQVAGGHMTLEETAALAGTIVEK